jgi:hypothetical protein
LPVKVLARVGLHTEPAAYPCVKRMPLLAKPSIFGVS